ncbi:HVO_A0114 family putative DNA-binding protein [Thiothrix subterranea]|uniref:Helix-turn-helix domain-containing protein n=1 Tax=Thiothrix subterranea TaxID=2735563 RepID=A0AA51R6K2_9GAMM|nr:helix-turn-helix domain-containing protein [Thiothrix subterranea]MDQ5767348.1 helix-turn-helix domain-containing protein [Thiothrix subterranea]WML88791.1 helix-turn-helix domain-containing protein [Thiothrix subterranea]
MRYAIIRIAPSLEADLLEMGAAFVDALETGSYQGEVFTFETPMGLFQAITPKRWELLDRLQGKAAVSIRELAKQLGRDVKNVHTDVSKLLEIGLLERDEVGRVFSPFAEIRTEFTLKGESKAAA